MACLPGLSYATFVMVRASSWSDCAVWGRPMRIAMGCDVQCAV